MTAGDAGRPDGGWVPADPLVEPDTQPLTRASIRKAREAAVRRAAMEWVARDGPSRGILSAAASAAVAVSVLVGLAALAGPDILTLAVGFTALVLVVGWALLTGAPSPRMGTVVLAAGALAVCATAGLTRTEPYLVWVPVTLALSVVAGFLHQVLRKGGRPRLTAGMASAVGALAITASGAALIPLARYAHGGSWVLMAAAAVAAGSLVLPFTPGRLSGIWGLVAVLALGTGAAAAVAVQQTGIPLTGAAIVGVLTSAIAHSIQRVLLGLPGSRGFLPALSVGAAAVLVAGVVVYLLTRLYAA